MARRRIDPAQGMAALRSWHADPGRAPRATVLLAVRFSLQELEESHPGRSVEVRVPPAGAVQILRGTVHRRGTPPAVVETDMATWLALAVGDLEWSQAEARGRVQASGRRADLAPLLPVFTAAEV
ncbi:MAG: sterol carrier family protein [Actinomyces sp.]|nr:sterol carrier family protein [Actinomyces sp.]MCI1787183.1 sterol carrier family protein [Actinomyces sp.]MCI1829577.1 sterol carrier family protein [Actinomyces sp.]MCI1866555.1 sterol carrier family protein [Actinomyces sp.]